MKFFVLLFAYAVLGWAQSCCQPPGGPNLARPVEANQSSTYIYALSPEVGGATVAGTADRAIDGNKESNAYLHPCSHTKYEQDPWWRLDMKQTIKIDTIVIVNRQDCCSERLLDAEVRVGNSADNNNPICGTINDISKPIITLCCNGMVGRYVSVVIPGREEYLTLCEVEVYAG